VLDATGCRYSLPEHHRPRGQGLKPKPSDSSPEEKRLRQEVPEIISYLEALKTLLRSGHASSTPFVAHGRGLSPRSLAGGDHHRRAVWIV
jgi:hypothetical protein